MRLPNEVTVEAMDAEENIKGEEWLKGRAWWGVEGVGGWGVEGIPIYRYEKMKIHLEGRPRSTDREKRRGQKNAWSTKLRQMRI